MQDDWNPNAPNAAGDFAEAAKPTEAPQQIATAEELQARTARDAYLEARLQQPRMIQTYEISSGIRSEVDQIEFERQAAEIAENRERKEYLERKLAPGKLTSDFNRKR